MIDSGGQRRGGAGEASVAGPFHLCKAVRLSKFLLLVQAGDPTNQTEGVPVSRVSPVFSLSLLDVVGLFKLPVSGGSAEWDAVTSLLAVALGPQLVAAAALSVGRGDVAGVWRLSSGPSPVPPPVREGRHRLGGLWDYDVGRKEVILVPDRPADADARNVHEVVLRGAVGWGGAAPGDAVLPLPAVEGGSVAIGRCFYPRSHPSFFDGTGPVVRATNVGTFSMAQVLGSMNTGLPSDGDGDEYDGGGSGDGGTTGDEPPGGPAHAAEDLVGRRFLMTVEPLSIRDEKDPDGALSATTPLDLRVLPVEFHQNETFTPRGVNKIRGGGTACGGSRLEMEVSLFGAGRSAPGSVYRPAHQVFGFVRTVGTAQWSVGRGGERGEFPLAERSRRPPAPGGRSGGASTPGRLRWALDHIGSSSLRPNRAVDATKETWRPRRDRDLADLRFRVSLSSTHRGGRLSPRPILLMNVTDVEDKIIKQSGEQN
ncbi:hypothetical protein THAOC_05517 [Thalassiosira oceanica]|uniref:Uncharacterized protein n=1 Tax=Thalassiosira oceanica TaxID=159749 RepID=K0T723_THAOC|nr:hypothetical protein THAOC_05517 [Thalassiosira oceanica]|eukprot:EJK72904.1 hypothetical protein THAOC_05517 [Thalassiosira oceanica]